MVQLCEEEGGGQGYILGKREDGWKAGLWEVGEQEAEIRPSIYAGSKPGSSGSQVKTLTSLHCSDLCHSQKLHISE